MMAKYLGEIEFILKNGSTEETICSADCTNAWEVGSVPQAWKDASIVTIYKKDDRTNCENYGGVTLVSIAGKILARILHNRLSIHITPKVFTETKYCFRGNRYDIFYPTATRKVH